MDRQVVCQHESCAVDQYAGPNGERGGCSGAVVAKLDEDVPNSAIGDRRLLSGRAADGDDAWLGVGDDVDECFLELRNRGRAVGG